MVRRKDEAVVVVGQKNRFAALDSDSEGDETDCEHEIVETAPAPQVPHAPIIMPVIKEEKRSYASAVSRGTTKGWVSIKWQGSQYMDDDEELSEKEIMKEALEEAGVLPGASVDDEKSQVNVSKGDAEVLKEVTSSPDLKPLWNRSTNTAAVWAEKVKQNLEKAEAARRPHNGSFRPTEDFVAGVGRLSFFRKEQ
jgi:hypothetical protein